MRWFIPFFILLFSAQKLSAFQKVDEKHFVLIVPSYNNQKWYQKNLDSLITQRYNHFRIIYINDGSTDNTGENVESFLQAKNIKYRVIDFENCPQLSIMENTRRFSEQLNEKETFFILVNNRIRMGACGNLYRAIHSCKDWEIAVTVDGDDWLVNNTVLANLNAYYENNYIWMTHGSLTEYPQGNSTWCERIPESYIERNAVREFKCPSHLRTFYTWLYKKIHLEDLLYQGDFFPMTWDMAIMYPMTEMAARHHAFIPFPIYVYNIVNPINDNKVNAQLQRDLEQLIKSKTRYQPLEFYEIPEFMNFYMR